MGKFRFASVVIILILLLFYNLGLTSTISKDIVFIIDNSGSMKKGDPDFLTKKAVAEFIKKLTDDTQVAVLIFDHRINLAVPLTMASISNQESILASLDHIDYRGMLTNIPDAMKAAISEIRKNGQDKSQRSIIFITDGKIDTGKQSRDIEKTKWLKERIPMGAAKFGVNIFGIAFTEQADFDLIQTLVRDTEGEYFKASTSEEIPGVFSRIFQLVMNEKPESIEPNATPLKAESVVSDESKPSIAIDPEKNPNKGIENKENTNQEHPEKLPVRSEIAQSPIYVTEKPVPTPESVKDMIEKPEPATPPIKHVMKKPGDLKPASAPSRSRRLPLPLPIIILIAIIILISTMVVLSRSRRRKAGAPTQKPQRPPSPPVPRRPKGVSSDFMPEALLRDVSEVTGEDTYKIREKNTKIGRKEKINQIVINQDTISRQHAVIEYKDYVYWIIDQDSANGTFLNGQEIEKEMRLNSGDTISFDVYDFEFILPGIESEKIDADKTVFRKSGELED